MAFIQLIEPQHRGYIPCIFRKEQRSESFEQEQQQKTMGNDKGETKSGIYRKSV